MKKHKEEVNPGGVNGTGEGVVNVNSKDYIGLQDAVRKHAEKQTPKEKMEYGLIALKFQMESYVSEQKPDEIIGAGEFLKRHIEIIGVSHKAFAQYIGLEESNLSAILNGGRNINMDLAFKLGQLFGMNPNLWLLIQNKNDLLAMDHSVKSEYEKFRLDDLLKKVS